MENGLTYEEIKQLLSEAKADRKNKAASLNETINTIAEKEQLEEDLREVLGLLQIAASKVQQHLEEDVSGIVTAALQTIPFKQPYEFVMDFVPRRNVTECDLLFKRGDNKIPPLDNSGYGAADIASFALRIAYWKISGGLRPVLIYDEPFSNLDKERQKYAVEILHRLINELDLQIIISSHERTLINGADKLFEVSLKGERSIVKEIT